MRVSVGKTRMIRIKTHFITRIMCNPHHSQYRNHMDTTWKNNGPLVITQFTLNIFIINSSFTGKCIEFARYEVALSLETFCTCTVFVPLFRVHVHVNFFWKIASIRMYLHQYHVQVQLSNSDLYVGLVQVIVLFPCFC